MYKRARRYLNHQGVAEGSSDDDDDENDDISIMSRAKRDKGFVPSDEGRLLFIACTVGRLWANRMFVYSYYA